MATDGFEIHFQEDQKQELGSWASKPVQPSPRAEDIDTPLIDEEIHKSYISCEITTVQPAQSYQSKTPACLLVLRYTFHPAIGRRFECLRISCTFKAQNQTNKSEGPTVEFHAPETCYGAYTQSTEAWKLSLSAPIKTPGDFFQFTPSLERSSSYPVNHFIKIEGSKRGSPRSQCVWTLEENGSGESGLPLNFQVAIILHPKIPSRPMVLDVDITGKIAGGPVSRAVNSVGVPPRLIDPAVPQGIQYPVKEKFEELKLGSYYLGALDASAPNLAVILPSEPPTQPKP